MRIAYKDEAYIIRKKYITAFIDTETKYYNQNINKQNQYSDGLCYDGYLWDCFFRFDIKDEFYCKQYISKKQKLYILWDIHSCDKIWIKDYWKYPKDAVLQMDYSEYLKLNNTLPEDIYVFDESFLWSIVFTHETGTDGKKWCIFAYNKELALNTDNN